MPILHVQITGQNKAPDGSLVPVDSSVAFIQRGPVVQASVSVAQQIAQPLLQQGISLPAPISGMALIDTGAQRLALTRMPRCSSNYRSSMSRLWHRPRIPRRNIMSIQSRSESLAFRSRSMHPEQSGRPLLLRGFFSSSAAMFFNIALSSIMVLPASLHSRFRGQR